MKEEINRRRVSVSPNSLVAYGNELYRIEYQLSVNEVIGIHLKTNRPKNLKISSLSAPSDKMLETAASQKDISMIDQDEWKSIETRIYGIQPIIEGKSTEEVQKRAEEIGVSFTTLYRWYRQYQNYGGVAGLLPKKRGRKIGERMIDVRADTIIKQVIDTFYLTHQRPNAQAVIRKVHTECHKRNIPLPSKNTIRNRLAAIDNRTKVSTRHSKQVARDAYDPAPGKFEAPYPLHTVQIDHTKMDVILVSEHDRQPIGRPWVTFAIDIYSRMIHGYYLSLEAPSATSDAMCIANAILPKDELLAQYNIDSNWDIWGFMDNVHVDNGADFRSETLRKACMLHGINIDFRPLGKTNYGGHIERMIGTIMAETHLIPGTTFSSAKEKGKYDPEKNATMTFSELEKWLLAFITKIYHKRVHHGIGMTPEEKFIEGVLNGEAAGIAAKPDSPQSIYLDFLPSFERTIQRNGVNIDGLNYYDGVLRSFIHAVDATTGKKRKFIFKRDPKDISEVWFYNEDDNSYYRIPAADQSIGHLTLFEFNELKRKAQEKQSKTGRRVSEREILMAYNELHEHVESTKQKTKKAKRQNERKHIAKKQHEQVLPKRDPFHEMSVSDGDDLWDNIDDIPDFDVE